MSLLALIFGTVIIILNIVTFKANYDHKPDRGKKSHAVDRLLRLQICLYDCLTGGYTVLIVVANFALQMKSSYCEVAQWWRGSLWCDALGSFFAFSCHGSLVIICLMSVTRGICCSFPFFNIPYRVVVRLSVATLLLNTVHSLIPVIPLRLLQEIFVSKIYLVNIKDNPFLIEYDENKISSLYQQVFSQSPKSTLEMLVDLRNITNKPEIFDYTTISYYGNSPLCIYNIFKNQEEYMSYKIGYCSFISIIVTVTAISYISIIYKAVVSRKESHATEPEDNDVRKCFLYLDRAHAVCKLLRLT